MVARSVELAFGQFEVTRVRCLIRENSPRIFAWTQCLAVCPRVISA